MCYGCPPATRTCFAGMIPYYFIEANSPNISRQACLKMNIKTCYVGVYFSQVTQKSDEFDI